MLKFCKKRRIACMCAGVAVLALNPAIFAQTLPPATIGTPTTVLNSPMQAVKQGSAPVAATTQPAPVQTAAAPACAACSTCGCDQFSCWDTITMSICPKLAPERQWTPLCCDTLFSKGWFEPQIGPPNGSGGSLRQGWIGVPDAFFNRQLVGLYNYTRGRNGHPDEQVGGFLAESPLSRRYDFGVIVPFIDAQNPGSSGFGDVTLENRFLLHETQDLTVSLNCNVRVPTGTTATGNHHTELNTYLAFYQDLGFCGWSIRGAAGIVDPLSGTDNKDPILTQAIGIGQTITPHDVPLFGDFTYYVCADFAEDTNSPRTTSITITPGIRTHLGHDWFLLLGVDFPVSSDVGFHERYNLVIVKGF